MATISQREAERLESLRKQDLAWRLHLAGASVQEIAASKDPDRTDTLFTDGRGAAQALAAARRRYDTDAEEAPLDVMDRVKSDIARLDRIQRALYPAATSGDVAAAREIRQITMARAQLLGYVRGVQDAGKGQADDPVDQLAAKREARRTTGA